MLDEGAKDWLSAIESKKRLVDRLSLEIREEEKRNSRLKSEKMRSVSNALLEDLTLQREKASAFIETETELFFQKIFGVEMYQPVAVKRANGVLTKALLATQLIARQLTNGLGVFTVTGDSVEQDAHKGLPVCEVLMAQEANDDWFVPAS
jgi:hypothetical protein